MKVVDGERKPSSLDLLNFIKENGFQAGKYNHIIELGNEEETSMSHFLNKRNVHFFSNDFLPDKKIQLEIKKLSGQLYMEMIPATEKIDKTRILRPKRTAIICDISTYPIDISSLPIAHCDVFVGYSYYSSSRVNKEEEILQLQILRESLNNKYKALKKRCYNIIEDRKRYRMEDIVQEYQFGDLARQSEMEYQNQNYELDEIIEIDEKRHKEYRLIRKIGYNDYPIQ
ncbi:MAG: hypothetical protein PHN72_05285 [Bacilli bacterium]|nr:hypothetical protein [Bacilli bacterium]